MFRILKNAVLFISVALLMIFSGCSTQVSNPLEAPKYVPKKVVYETEILQKKTISEIMTIYGNIVPLKRMDVSFKVGGYLKEFLISSGETVKAGDPLGVLESPDLSAQLRDQEFTLEKARLTYEKALMDYNITGRNKDTMEIAKLNLQIAQFNYDKVKTQNDNLILYSPMDGVIENVSGHVGTYINPGTSVIRIRDDSKRLLSIKSTSELDFIVMGSELNFVIHPETFISKVVAIDAASSTILLEPLDQSFNKPLGTSAVVEIVLNSKENVIVIPVSAIKAQAGRNYVEILDDGVRAEREIRTGIRTNTHTEVIFGLEEGDELILSTR